DVHVEPVGAARLDRGKLLCQSAEVGGQERWRDAYGCGPHHAARRRRRAAKDPSTPWTCGSTRRRPASSTESGTVPGGGGSSAKSVCAARNVSTCSSFSSTSSEHVLYTSRPPGRTTVAAASSSVRCTTPITARSLGLRRHRASGCRRKVPVPVHGASRSTTSTGRTHGRRASATTGYTLGTAMRRTESAIRKVRAKTASHAATRAAVRDSSKAFPPGAAHRSATVAFGGTAAYRTTIVAPGSCTKQWPCWNTPSAVTGIPCATAIPSGASG